MNALFRICCAFLFVGVAYGQIDPEVAEALNPYLDPCIEELGISPEDMNKFEDRALEGEDRTKLGCLKACMMKRMDTLVDGKVVPENIEEFLKTAMAKTPEKIPEALDTVRRCADEVKDITEECELAYELSRCFAT